MECPEKKGEQDVWLTWPNCEENKCGRVAANSCRGERRDCERTSRLYAAVLPVATKTNLTTPTARMRIFLDNIYKKLPVSCQSKGASVWVCPWLLSIPISFQFISYLSLSLFVHCRNYARTCPCTSVHDNTGDIMVIKVMQTILA
jgi:hypothetical protein